jgi:hypothetical protein
MAQSQVTSMDQSIPAAQMPVSTINQETVPLSQEFELPTLPTLISQVQNRNLAESQEIDFDITIQKFLQTEYPTNQEPKRNNNRTYVDETIETSELKLSNWK